MRLTEAMILTEMLHGARLFRHPQYAGGYRWAMYGAKITPASLDKHCDKLESDGHIVRKPGERAEYVRWQENNYGNKSEETHSAS